MLAKIFQTHIRRNAAKGIADVEIDLAIIFSRCSENVVCLHTLCRLGLDKTVEGGFVVGIRLDQ